MLFYASGGEYLAYTELAANLATIGALPSYTDYHKWIYSAAEQTMYGVGSATNGGDILKLDLLTGQTHLIPLQMPTDQVLGAAYDVIESTLYTLDVTVDPTDAGAARFARLISHNLFSQTSTVLLQVPYDEVHQKVFLANLQPGYVMISASDNSSRIDNWVIGVDSNGEAQVSSMTIEDAILLDTPVRGLEGAILPLRALSGEIFYSRLNVHDFTGTLGLNL